MTQRLMMTTWHILPSWQTTKVKGPSGPFFYTPPRTLSNTLLIIAVSSRCVAEDDIALSGEEVEFEDDAMIGDAPPETEDVDSFITRSAFFAIRSFTEDVAGAGGTGAAVGVDCVGISGLIVPRPPPAVEGVTPSGKGVATVVLA